MWSLRFTFWMVEIVNIYMLILYLHLCDVDVNNKVCI